MPFGAFLLIILLRLSFPCVEAQDTKVSAFSDNLQKMVFRLQIIFGFSNLLLLRVRNFLCFVHIHTIDRSYHGY